LQLAADASGWRGGGRSGLFVELARGCGRPIQAWNRSSSCAAADAAERFLNWDYADGAGVERQLREFTLLVAPRGAPFVPPERLRAAVHPLDLARDGQTLSSTELRQRIKRAKRGAPAPEEIAAEIERAYR